MLEMIEAAESMDVLEEAKPATEMLNEAKSSVCYEYMTPAFATLKSSTRPVLEKN